ncbi:COX15/CtaA family protein [Sphingomonas oligoaromativorans]|uniref:COX15/CtaA family protein n=1 Tax=Sphingomonas oligoaromativorans TaxID=575322 RepID=UPI00141E99D1|nr:COX15/CtaA family protein [Sphingomonas oligoaromativorans]NIJ34377.1 cytochrome c oxidase assembly protein subunit 15 [Sphingomonas oligoaromativorans]
MSEALPSPPALKLPGRPAAPRPAPRAFGGWLLVVAALVLAIVIVGGITRLTESGLSIVEWDPILGTIPPLTQAQWQAAFDGYKAIPQYHAFNTGMTLEGFKHIYFWEYLHRLIARGIGTVLLAVLAVFWWRRAIPKGYGWRAVLIFALGGLQGVVGWWMVSSGLVYRTEVSHIRLAIHLLTALLIYSYLIWTALDLLALARDPSARPAKLTGLAAVAIAILAIQIMLGAFTAGLRAGYAFATWPKMGEDWFPAGGWNAGQSTLHNLVYNPVAVQFVHRWWAWVALVAVVMVARFARQAGNRQAAAAIVVAVVVQILLGIATLLTGVDIPIAVTHQAVATILLGTLIWGGHALGREPKAA